MKVSRAQVGLSHPLVPVSATHAGLCCALTIHMLSRQQHWVQAWDGAEILRTEAARSRKCNSLPVLV